MNGTVTTICYCAFFISTVFTLLRAKYALFAAILAGIFSPLVFIALFAMVDFPLSMLVGKLNIPESVLPQNVVSLFAAIIVVVGWFVGGLFITRQKRPPEKPN